MLNALDMKHADAGLETTKEQTSICPKPRRLERVVNVDISRVWAMPSKNTFNIKPVNELIQKWVRKGHPSKIIDPFANESCFNQICFATNDLSNEYNTTHHMEALDFLKQFEDSSIGMVLFDPPWTMRQISESYKNVGREGHSYDTTSGFYSQRKKEVARIVKKNGIVICCGYNSGGVGKTLGFELLEVLLVPHGGAHNDSIITVERKLV